MCALFAMLTAVILRFLRSKIFLTAILIASFTYFILSFSNDVSSSEYGGPDDGWLCQYIFLYSL